MNSNILLLTCTQSRPETLSSDTHLPTPQQGGAEFQVLLQQFVAQVDPELYRRIFSVFDTLGARSPFPRVKAMPLPVIPVVNGKIEGNVVATSTVEAPPVRLPVNTRPCEPRVHAADTRNTDDASPNPDILAVALPIVALTAAARRPEMPVDGSAETQTDGEATECTPATQPAHPAAQTAAQALALLAQPPVSRGRWTAPNDVPPDEQPEPATDAGTESDTAPTDETVISLDSPASDPDGTPLPQLPAALVMGTQEQPPAVVTNTPPADPTAQLPVIPTGMADDPSPKAVVSDPEPKLRMARPSLPTPVSVRNTEQPEGLPTTVVTGAFAVPEGDVLPPVAGPAIERESRLPVSETKMRPVMERDIIEVIPPAAGLPDTETEARDRTGGGAGNRSYNTFTSEEHVSRPTESAIPAFDRSTDEPAKSVDRVSGDVLARRTDASDFGQRTAQTARAHETPVPEHMADPQRMIDQIVTAVRMEVSSHRRELIVRLDPPQLGVIHVRVSSEAGGAMAVRVETAHPWLRDLLDINLPELRRSFADAGINVDQCGVSLHMDAHPGQSQFNETGPQGRHASYHARNDQPEIVPKVAMEPAGTRRAHHGMLDMLA